jgi:hypothetical protein
MVMKRRTVISSVVSTLLAVSILTFGVSTEIASAHGGNHNEPCTGPHKNDAGCDDGGDGGDVAENDIGVRWMGAAVSYIGPGTADPLPELLGRYCSIGDPQPNGTHTAWGCTQEDFHLIDVFLTGGTVLDSKGGAPDQADIKTCGDGFEFNAYPNAQYVVAVGLGEVCTDDNGCPIRIHNVMNGQKYSTGYDHVKLVGDGEVLQSTNLNPFACPTAGEPSPQILDINTIEVRVKNGKGSKADLVCLFNVEGTTSFEVTPVCP